MNEEYEIQLIKEGLQLLDDALARFMMVKESKLGVDLANAAHGLLCLGEFCLEHGKN